MQITRKGFLKRLTGAAVAGGLFGRAAAALSIAQESSGATARQTKIADVQLWPATIREKVTIKIALGSEDTAENIFLRLRTADGVVGWGEASPFSRVTSETQASALAMGKKLAEMVRGVDPFTIPKIVADMDAFTPGSSSIKAAYEMALWDICGKIARQPVVALFGQFRDSFPTDRTIFLGTPSEMAGWAQENVRMGFKTVKVKLGEAPDYDVERIRAVRVAVGKDINLRIDANQGWSPAGAVHALKNMESCNLESCEQPVPHWDVDGLAYVHEHSPIPIMADEAVHSPHDAISLVRKDACDIINIKLMKSGGILNGMRIAQIAAAANMNCMVGCMSEGTLALTAAASLVASCPNIIYADLDGATFLAIDPVIGGMQIKDGNVILPKKPGLGVEVDPAFLKTLHPAL